MEALAICIALGACNTPAAVYTSPELSSGIGTRAVGPPHEASYLDEKTIYAFQGAPTDGSSPRGGLILGAGGALYGTTGMGGPDACIFGAGCGTAFKLTPSGSQYSEQVLHFLGGFSGDGALPIGNLLELGDRFYGATEYGGSTDSCGYDGGCGTIFELIPSSSGFQESVVYSFGLFPDAELPNGSLVADSAGALYGTSSYGGKSFGGTVFKLTPTKNGYRESVLHSFPGGEQDGVKPLAGVILDKNGSLYGTTAEGEGDAGYGTVFKLTKMKHGYVEHVIYAFKRCGIVCDGEYPVGGLIMDTSGALYGTTEEGGDHQTGTAFKLISSGSAYVEAALYSFGPVIGFGALYPNSSLTAGRNDELYGVSRQGGTHGAGTVFELRPTGSSFAESVLYSFGEPTDGATPVANLLLANGLLYGTTSLGGLQQHGIAFGFAPGEK